MESFKLTPLNKDFDEITNDSSENLLNNQIISEETLQYLNSLLLTIDKNYSENDANSLEDLLTKILYLAKQYHTAIPFDFFFTNHQFFDKVFGLMDIFYAKSCANYFFSCCDLFSNIIIETSCKVPIDSIFQSHSIIFKLLNYIDPEHYNLALTAVQSVKYIFLINNSRINSMFYENGLNDHLKNLLNSSIVLEIDRILEVIFKIIHSTPFDRNSALFWMDFFHPPIIKSLLRNSAKSLDCKILLFHICHTFLTSSNGLLDELYPNKEQQSFYILSFIQLINEEIRIPNQAEEYLCSLISTTMDLSPEIQESIVIPTRLKDREFMECLYSNIYRLAPSEDIAIKNYTRVISYLTILGEIAEQLEDLNGFPMDIICGISSSKNSSLCELGFFILGNLLERNPILLDDFIKRGVMDMALNIIHNRKASAQNLAFKLKDEAVIFLSTSIIFGTSEWRIKCLDNETVLIIADCINGSDSVLKRYEYKALGVLIEMELKRNGIKSACSLIRECDLDIEQLEENMKSPNVNEKTKEVIQELIYQINEIQNALDA